MCDNLKFNLLSDICVFLLPTNIYCSYTYTYAYACVYVYHVNANRVFNIYHTETCVGFSCTSPE